MTQCQNILAYMKKHGSITPKEADRELGCMRLAARIADLRKEGHAIGVRRKTVKKPGGETVSFAEYYMEGNHA